MVLKYTLAWIPMVFIAIANGIIREFVYKKHTGELTAHQISTITLIIFFTFYVWGLSFLWKLETASQAVIIGLIWLGLTVLFEFIFGHYVMGHPWSKLLHDYNIMEGRIWILILLWTAIVPYVIFRLRA